MPTYQFTVQGVRLSERLTARLEEHLQPFALEDARASLREAEATRIDLQTTEEMRAQYVAEAQAGVRQGGWMHWQRWDVTDSEGVSRSKSGGSYDEPLVLPSLQGALSAALTLKAGVSSFSKWPTVELRATGSTLTVHIEAEDDVMGELRHGLAALVEEFVDPDLLPPPPTFKVFIGHGGDPQWKYLHRALNETHDMLAEAFESTERAGYHTLVAIDQMVRSSTVAVVVMTGEDEVAGGKLRARENVVHEVGFCQGALGIENTIVLLEEGISEPSNIAGLTQIRFPRGRLIDVEDRIVEVLGQRRQVYNYQQA